MDEGTTAALLVGCSILCLLIGAAVAMLIVRRRVTQQRQREKERDQVRDRAEVVAALTPPAESPGKL